MSFALNDDQRRIQDLARRVARELISDQYLWETGFLSWYDHPSGYPHVALGFPIEFSASPAGMTRPPPLLGRHNQEILGQPLVPPKGTEGKASP
jgi:crotonobetainyl-CoA:carnitine CoA-transferase CaiB-like acyl-CoA transferase